MTILCRLGYLWAAGRFCRKYLEISRVKEKIWMVVLLGGDILLNGLQNKFTDLPNILFTLGQHVVLIGSVMMFRGGTEKKLLTGSILTTMTTLTGSFFTSLTACLVLVWKHNWHDIPAPFIEARDESLIICIMLLANMLAVYWLSRRQLSFFSIGNGSGLKKGYIVLAMPLLAVTLVTDVANWGASHGVMVRSGGNMGLYYDQLFSHTEFLLLTALSMFAAGFYLFALDRIYLEQKKSSQYHARIAAYQMLEEQYSQMERLRHDMKNHVIALMGLLENGEWEKMGDYLESMRDSGGFGKAEEATGNRAVDALLHQKRQEAERRKIRWECDVQMPKPCCINEFDMCILFGNILDNAVEACERLRCRRPLQEDGDEEGERFIHIRARSVKKCFLLEVRNSVRPEEEYENGKSSQLSRGNMGERAVQGKGDAGRRHGIGLINIKDMVKRYDGVMNTEFQDGVFTISVLVPLEEKPDKRKAEM